MDVRDHGGAENPGERRLQALRQCRRLAGVGARDDGALWGGVFLHRPDEGGVLPVDVRLRRLATEPRMGRHGAEEVSGEACQG